MSERDSFIYTYCALIKKQSLPSDAIDAASAAAGATIFQRGSSWTRSVRRYAEEEEEEESNGPYFFHLAPRYHCSVSSWFFESFISFTANVLIDN